MNNNQTINNFDTTNEKSTHSPLGYIIKNEKPSSLFLPWIPSPFSYLSAFLIVSSVVVFQYSLLPEPAVAPFIFFFPAIYLVAFLGGLLPGLLAVVLSALAGNFFFIAPYWSWSTSFESLAATFLFVASSFILFLLSLYFRKVMLNFNRAVNERQKAEANVRRANEEWDRTFNAISDFTFIQDKDFGIVRVNRAFADILKLKPEEIIGKKCYEILHKSGQPWKNCPFEKTRVDLAPHTEEVFDPIIGLPLLVTTSPIFSQTGEFIGSIHIAKDITELKLTEEKLREASDYLNKLLGYANAPVIVWNTQRKITLFNRAFEKLTGYTAAEVIGQELDMLFPRETKQQSLSSIAKTASGEYWETVEIPIRRKDGEVRIALWNSANIFSADGVTLTATIAQGQDITERKRAEEILWQEKAKIESLLSSIGDGIVAVDPAGKILFINRAFASLVKKSRNDLLDKGLNEIVPLEDDRGNQLSLTSRPIFLALASGERVSLNIFSRTYYLRQDNKLIPLAITATPVILDGATIGAIAVYRDISKEKAVDQAKTEFVSLASHQLRTPLSSIALSIELLLRGVAGEVSQEQRKYLSEAYNSTKTMAELIKVLLDISRIELGTFMVQLEPINLAESLDYLLDELKLQLNNKKLTLHKKYNISPIVQFDKNILRTTIENLVTNAIRYTGEGGAIAVSLEENLKEVLIKITDTGCGIPEKDHDKVFTKLFRAENARLISADGAGLGLYLVKSLLNIAHCRIWFESELGKGTTFFVAIPISFTEILRDGDKK